jgi:NAD-dependent deacetylase
VADDDAERLIIDNSDPRPYDDLADEVLRDPIGTALPELLGTLRSSGDA